MPVPTLSSLTRRARVLNWHASNAVSLSASMAVSKLPRARKDSSIVGSHSSTNPARPSFGQQKVKLLPGSLPRYRGFGWKGEVDQR